MLLAELATAAEATRPQNVAQCCKVTFRVRVPEGTGTVYLAGSLS